MGYKMKGFSGFKSSPIKQKPVEIFDKDDNYTIQYKNRMKTQKGFKKEESAVINQFREAFDLKPLSKDKVYKKGDIIHKFDYSLPKRGGANIKKSPTKKKDVYEYLDDGTKKKISYEEGVKKANQNKNIQFTGKDLIKALESGALDEFNHPSQRDEVRQMITDEKATIEKTKKHK